MVFEIGDERLWMRPLGGFAMFDPVVLTPSETFALVALDENGTEIARYTDVVPPQS